MRVFPLKKKLIRKIEKKTNMSYYVVVDCDEPVPTFSGSGSCGYGQNKGAQQRIVSIKNMISMHILRKKKLSQKMEKIGAYLVGVTCNNTIVADSIIRAVSNWINITTGRQIFKGCLVIDISSNGGQALRGITEEPEIYGQLILLSNRLSTVALFAKENENSWRRRWRRGGGLMPLGLGFLEIPPKKNTNSLERTKKRS